MHRPRRPALVLLAVATLLLALGCRSGRNREEPLRSAEVDCHDLAAGEEDRCRALVYFRDTLDSGDDPLNAGCHMRYDDAACTQNARAYRGDFCTSSVDLVEYTDTSCHSGRDRANYDCDAHCRSLGHAAGECRRTADAFCHGLGSAYCKCTGPT